LCVIKKPRKNEETKPGYRAVKIQSEWVVTPGTQTNKLNVDTFESKEGVDKIDGHCTLTGYETLGVIQLSFCH